MPGRGIDQMRRCGGSLRHDQVVGYYNNSNQNQDDPFYEVYSDLWNQIGNYSPWTTPLKSTGTLQPSSEPIPAPFGQVISPRAALPAKPHPPPDRYYRETYPPQVLGCASAGVHWLRCGFRTGIWQRPTDKWYRRRHADRNNQHQHGDSLRHELCGQRSLRGASLRGTNGRDRLQRSDG
jgi:hypothetical protein